MDAILRWLWIDRDRWERVGPESVASAAAVVAVFAGLTSFVRFGGLVTDAPRAFVRLTLVGIWGWILLATTIAGSAVAFRVAVARGESATDRLRRAFAIVGRAHLPLLVLVGVTIVAGIFLQLSGPGLLVSVFVIGVWLPAALVTGVRAATGAPWWSATAVVAGPYALWFTVIARHLLEQIGHLL